MKQSQKKKSDWTQFLSGIPARDYIFQNIPYGEQIKQAATLIREAETILIGAGAGTSTAAGIAFIQPTL